MMNPASGRAQLIVARRVVTGLLLFACFVMLFRFTVTDRSGEDGETCENVAPKSESVKPVIMFKTTFFGSPMTSDLGYDNCNNDCEFVNDYDPKNLNADVLVYHHRNIPDVSTDTLHCRQTPTVLFTMESPVNTEISDNLLNQFDYVLSYRNGTLNSKRPYDRFVNISPSSHKDTYYNVSEVREAILAKKKPLLVLVSHCSTPSKREVYIEALSQYIPVTVLGSCSDSPCDEECQRQAIRDHYFHLSFENSICEDYVTEKFWRMKELIVPVVLSRQIVAQVAPGDSFIAVDDFSSAAELAVFLYRLMEDERRYEGYFNWTKSYLKTTAPTTAACELCTSILSNRAAFAHPGPHPQFTAPAVESWLNSGHCQDNFALRYLSHDEYNVITIFPPLTSFGRKIAYTFGFSATFMFVSFFIMLIVRRIALRTTHSPIPKL
uniref:Fucosyltransferase n=1 Tax=Panagrellus redivivus TaxID=6233 RepID=A0A7E4VBY0_PANRE